MESSRDGLWGEGAIATVLAMAWLASTAQALQPAAVAVAVAVAVAKQLEDQQAQVWCPDPVMGWMLRKVVSRDVNARTVEVEPLTEAELKTLKDTQDEGGVVMNNARIRSASGARKNVVLKKRMKTKFKNIEVQPLDPTHLLNLDDIANMDNLHEAPLLHLLKRRYEEDCIYTHVGEILVSLNPFKPIAGLYELPAESELKKRATAALQSAADEQQALDLLAPFTPHVYSTADQAYSKLLQGLSAGRDDNQSILVSGESGAGKTEACKYIMRYLAASSKAMQSDSGAGTIDVEQCLLQSNPLLEAFGNSVTLRNNNSSRFGKLIRISYNKQGCMIGAHTQHFLLEKSRVVCHCVGERNYHIFYQLTQDAAACAEVGLLETSSYAYLCDKAEEETSAGGDGKETDAVSAAEDGKDGGGDWWQGSKGVTAPSALPQRRTSIMGLPNDSEEFAVTLEALKACGVTDEEKNQLQHILAAILNLGNINFTEDEKQHSSVVPADPAAASDVYDSDEEGKHPLADIAGTLGFVPDLLDLKLTQRELSAGSRSSLHRVPLTQLQAMQSRDAFAKAVYSNLFGWLVDKVNSAVKTEEALTQQAQKQRGVGHFLGLLDIFGFEVMTVNSFEQLMINYANEVLQHFFNQRVFVKEQSFYEAEKVQLPKVWFLDNVSIVDLIKGAPNGILQLLDQQNKLGGSGSDKQFLSSIYRAHGGVSGAKHLAEAGGKSHPNLLRPKYGGECFVIKHFAGQVQYEAKGFIAKNNESLTPDLAQLVLTTSNSFLGAIFEAGSKKADGLPQAAEDKKRKASRAAQKGNTHMNKLLGSETVSLTFREQMNSLQEILQTTSSHFLRCVKPNRAQMPATFDGPMILEQLMYLGVLETIRIRQHGYPVRKDFPSFIRLYQPLIAQLALEVKVHGEKEVCKRVVAAYLDEEMWQVGVTRVFLKTGQTNLLDQAVLKVRYMAATRLQAHARTRKINKQYVKQLRSIVKIQALIRGFLGACEAQRIYLNKVSATRIAAFYRGAVVRRQFLKKKQGIALLQAACRGARYRKEHGVLHLTALKIQKEARRRQGVAQYQKKRWAALRMHTIARGFLGKLMRRKLGTDYQSSQKIQAHVRCFVATRQYERIQASTLTAQRIARAQGPRKTFNKQRLAAIFLQKIARRRAAHRRYTSMLIIVNLQRIFRAGKVRQAVVLKEIELAKKGMLFKRSVRGRRGYNWKYRSFELVGSKLEYRKAEGVMSKFKKQAGVFVLDDHSDVKASDLHDFAFMVSGKFQKEMKKLEEGEKGEERQLFCYASSEEERDEWMKKLALNILACNTEKAKALTMSDLLHLRKATVDPSIDKANPKMNLLGAITGGGKRRASKSQLAAASERRNSRALVVGKNEGEGPADGDSVDAPVEKAKKAPRTSLIGRFRSKSKSSAAD